MRDPLHRFAEIWCVDTEFVSRPGERPIPVCLVAREFRTKRTIRLWRNQLGALPPYPVGPSSLFVAFFASAEIGFHLALGWPKPVRILDLFAEFKCLYNCRQTVVEQKLHQDKQKVGRNSLLGATIQFGLDTTGVGENRETLELILSESWTPADELVILQYCTGHVIGLDQLLTAMLPRLDIPRGLLRGRYIASVASMEFAGVPIDVELLNRLRDRWGQIQQELVNRIDAQYGVYDGTSFRSDRFERYLAARGILWPRYGNGKLMLKDSVFRDMSKLHPELNPLRELRYSLSQLRLNDLAVGQDGRNRCLISPFSTRSSRNAPSNSKFIFGPAVWLRGLIKPPPGFGLDRQDAQLHGTSFGAHIGRF